MSSAAIKARARELGFSLCRILPVAPAPHGDFFTAWLDRGNAADMHYLSRQIEGRLEPGRLAGAGGTTFRSMVVLGVDYFRGALDPAVTNDPSRGLIAAFAWAADYHEVIKPRLYDLDAFVRTLSGRTTFGRCFVDTGPVLERDWAQRAGLGFMGKNCCVIHPSLGSWLFLATMLVPEVLDPDPPMAAAPASTLASTSTSAPTSAPTSASASASAVGDAADAMPTTRDLIEGVPGRTHFGAWDLVDDEGIASLSRDFSSGPSRTPPATPSRTPSRALGTCGRCDRCLVACPTEAFVGPFHLDARRCISYWTIETQAAIPPTLRARFGNRIFGCDICQEVCPWNRGRLPALDTAAAARVAPPLLEGFAPATPYWLDDEAFYHRFRRTSVTRAKRVGMLRNVCVALGNWESPDALDALRLALCDASPIARAHAAWALGRIARTAPRAATQLLTEALRDETQADTRTEIEDALSRARA